MPGATDWGTFTVVWVQPVTIKFTGSVDANNDQLPDYMKWTADGKGNLGPQRFNAYGTDKLPTWGWGYETIGLVEPANFSYDLHFLKNGQLADTNP